MKLLLVGVLLLFSSRAGFGLGPHSTKVKTSQHPADFSPVMKLLPSTKKDQTLDDDDEVTITDPDEEETRYYPQYDLADYSHSNIQYRVVSLTDSVRRPLIDLLFSAANQYIDTTNKIPRAAHQTAISWGYFDAIRGINLDQSTLVQKGYYKGSGLNPGELGLLMTTTDIIIPFAMSLSSNGILTIFEDDVIIPVDVDLSFRMALKQAPANWDILFLGCNQNSMVGPNGAAKSPFYPRNLSVKEGYAGNLCSKEAIAKISQTPWVRLLRCTPGTWAYALRQSSAQKLNNLLNSMKPLHQPIDIIYRGLANVGKINAYCLKPELIRPNYALPSFLR